MWKVIIVMILIGRRIIPVPDFYTVITGIMNLIMNLAFVKGSYTAERVRANLAIGSRHIYECELCC